MAKAAGPPSWDREHLLDLFSAFGPVTFRRMFSGFGISADGVNFAMALRAGIIFRVDDETVAGYEAEGARPFQYSTSKKTIVVQSYWHIPERLYDDPDEFAEWARDALGAARRAKLTKSSKPSRVVEKSGRVPPRRAIKNSEKSVIKNSRLTKPRRQAT